MTIRMAAITTRSEPGITEARVVMLDDTIPIDGYIPSQPDLLWYCDHCGGKQPVTAQFHTGEVTSTGNRILVTLCRACLQNGINGIDHSLANPISAGDL